MEIRATEAHEHVDCEVPGWVALYGLSFQDGMRLSIPRLVKEVLDRFKITSNQLMPNAWHLLIFIECLSMRHGVEFELGEVLFSYYLKEHDKKKGHFQLLLRRERSLLVTCLWSNDSGWKDK